MGAESKPLLTALGWTKEVRAQRQVATANVGTEPPAGLVLLLRLYILSLPFTGFMLLNLSWIGFGVSPGYISSAMLFFFWLLRDRTHSSKPLTIPGKIAIVYVVFVFLSVVQSGAIPAGVGAFYEKKPWLYGFTQSIYVA
ncbi:MAG TPA: hypothetical protein VG892_00665, partial [Terriglobales bacterium]|nr:hypothetical protein [Terriglobales bacterium]